MIYLDNAATTLRKPPEVANAMVQALRTMASPGRGGHRPAMAAADTAYACRTLAGELFGVDDPERVILTFNATHGLNIAIRSLVGPGDPVVISGWEHNAVTRPLHAIGAEIRVAEAPLFDPAETWNAFDRLITPEVRCVICTQVSNVFGMILPVQELAALCREREVPFIVDASQGAGCLPLDVDGWGLAFAAMPGHKGLYGPQGTGLFLCGRDVQAVPLLQGGTGGGSKNQLMPEFLPDRLEAGTHNMPGIAGLLEGLRFVRRKTPEGILAHERDLLWELGEGLAMIPAVTTFRDADPAGQAGVLSFRVTGADCEVLAERLGERGIAVRAGLHCAPLAHWSAGTLATGTVRVSLSAFNTRVEIQRFLTELRRILKE